MKDFWNDRYAREEYVYGTRPNAWFEQQLDLLEPGKLLLPAEGEGRNAIYAAEKGWEVTAFDLSSVGKDKALQLAIERRVDLTYHVGELSELKLVTGYYDAVAMIFAHFPYPKRKEITKELISLLKPGGHLILECFSKGQVEYQQKYDSGGPRLPEILYSLDEIREEFSGLSFSHLEEKEIELDEGVFHRGKASVIRFCSNKLNSD